MEKLKIKDLVNKEGEVFVSIYLPTHRTSIDNKQDQTRLSNLVNEAKKQIQEKFENIEIEEYFEGINNLKNSEDFWKNGNEGLVILINENETVYQRLSGNTPEKVVVGDRYHLLPLINYYELPNDYYLLDISKDRFELFQVGSEGIKNIETPSIERRFDDLFTDKDVEDGDLKNTGGASSTMHGHQSKPEIDEKETEKYMRYVATHLVEFFKPRSFPIVLFGTTENVSEFKNIIGDEVNIVTTIDKPLDSMEREEILESLKANLLPEYLKKIDEKIEDLNSFIANDKGSDNLSRIQKDSETGRIETLFIEKDNDTEEIDKLVYDVINGGGEIILVDEEHNKLPSGIAASYRY